MRSTERLVVVGALALLVIIVAGQFCINLNVKTEYSVGYGPDGVSYDIDLGYVSNYSVVTFDDGGLGRNSEFVFCFDHEHVWYKSDDFIQNTLDHLARDMEERGLTLTVMDTKGVVNLMESDVDSGSSDTTVIFMTGSFPFEIYNGEEGCHLTEWLGIGGDLVWGSGPIGFNISTETECVPAENDPGTVLFGVEGAVNNGESRTFDNVSYTGGLADMFRLYFSETTWGVQTGVSEDQLVTEYQTNGHSALSVTRYHGGSGSITVFGGDVDNNVTSYVAQFLASGLGYSSEITDYQMGIGKQASGTLKAPASNTVVFLSIGLMNDNIVLYRNYGSVESVE